MASLGLNELINAQLLSPLVNHWRYLNIALSHHSDGSSGERSFTHQGRVTHICVSNLTIIGSDNGLSPGWRHAIIRTNAGILLIGPLETNFNEILIKIYIFWFKKMHLKMSSWKWRPFCLGLNVLIAVVLVSDGILSAGLTAGTSGTASIVFNTN